MKLVEVNPAMQQLAALTVAQWWECARCGQLTQAGFIGLRAHTAVVHGARTKAIGEPTKEQEWKGSSSTGSRSHLRAVSSSPTADSPET